MTPQEEIAAYEAEKREAQLHQFAAAALTGLVAHSRWDEEKQCSWAWSLATEMMRLKPEIDNG